MRFSDDGGGPSSLHWKMTSLFLLSLLLFSGAARAQDEDPHGGGPPPGTSSLAFVFDITGSMFDDLVQVRNGAKEIFRTVMAQREKLIYNYILVPFHDPELGEIINTTDSMYFQRQLNKVHVFGGGDCPEMTLTGIKTALEIALPSSFIYVFTDARSKDYHLEEQVLNLIQEKQSSVVFVMTGDCGNRTHAGFRTYEKIAAASFGQVFHLQKSDVSKVLEYVKHAVVQKKVHIMYEARDHGGQFSRFIPVDREMTELTLSLSGDKADDEALDIVLKDPSGRIVDKNQYNKEGGTIDLKNVKLIRLKDPTPGNWQVITKSTLKHTLRVFGHGAIDFKYGFSTRPVSRVELASPRPTANQMTYLMVNMTGLNRTGTVDQIELVDYYGRPLYSQAASPSPSSDHMYFVGPFVPPKGLFFVKVTGQDDHKLEYQRIAPTAIGSVQIGGPRAYMAERIAAFSGQAVNLSCSVESPSKFQLYWRRKNGEVLTGPLFYGVSDTSIWTINSVSQEDRGEYECLVVSEHGNTTRKTFLETRETPPQIVMLRNESAVIGTDAFLHCKTSSNSRVDYRWLHHGQPVMNNPRARLMPNGTLWLSSVTRADAGGYECQAKNTGGVSTQGMLLRIFDLPRATISPKEFFFVPRTSMNVSCSVSGDPFPEVMWFHNNVRIEPDRKYYITFKNDLIIRDPEEVDHGQYECRAISAAGSASDFATAKIAKSPKVRIEQSKKMIGRGDNLTLECIVESGEPAPSIMWFRNNREVMLSSHEYVRIEGNRLHISGAQDADAGSYSCVAENIAGRDLEVVKVQVGSIPSIVPSPEVTKIHIERQGSIPCRAIGHPPPKVSWKRDGIDIAELDDETRGRYQVTVDGSLLINNAQLEDETRFTCVATNDYGTQSRTTTVHITGMVAPVLGQVPPEEQLIEGEDLRLSCIVVLGTPKPEIKWYKDDKPIEETSSLIIENGGTSLLLRDGNPADEGKYTCVAVSPAGNATINVAVQLITVPTIDAGKVDLFPRANLGHPITIECPVGGHPFPLIRWQLNGVDVVESDLIKLSPDGQAIEIISVQEKDAGRWTCLVENDAGTAEQDFTLDVWLPPKVEVSAVNNTAVKAIGEAIVLLCNASGNPQPVLTWNKNGLPIVSSPDGARISQKGARLDIPKLSKDDVGDYTCAARNEAGSDEASVHVDVLVPPSIARNGIDLFPKLPSGETIKLNCDVNGKPTPEIKWFINDTVEITATTGSITLGPEKKYIQVANLTLADRGRYSCVTENSAGHDKLEYHVQIVQSPVIGNGGTSQVIEGEVARMECDAEGEPTPVITWLRNGLRIETGVTERYAAEGKVLSIVESRSSDSGLYVCQATNEAGSVQQAYTLEVLVKPMIHSTSPNETSVPAKTKFTLKCGSRGYPEPTIAWFIDETAIHEDDVFSIDEEGTLTVNGAPKKQQLFRCTASNEAGQASIEYTVRAISAPTVSKDGVTSQNATEGTAVLLHCGVEGEAAEIVWTKDGARLNPSVGVNFTEDRTAVNIAAAKLSDQGTYICKVKNTAGEAEQKIQMFVGIPPRVSDQPQHVIAKNGETAELWCEATGVPQPHITWYKDDVKITETAVDKSTDTRKATAIFPDVGLEHAGIYTCKAENWAGTSYKEIGLVVLTAPIITPEKDNVTADLRDTIYLNCNSSGNPEPVISWVRPPNVEIENNEKYELLGTTLAIRNAVEEDAGFYHCIAKSQAGQALGTRNVILKGAKPKDPDFIWVECDEDGKPTKTNMVQSRGDVPGGEMEHWGSDQAEPSQIPIRCLPGSPRAGRTPVGGLPRFLHTPVSQNVKLGTVFELFCSAIGQPEPVIYWTKDGQFVNETGFREYNSILRINMTNSDEPLGEYKCHARNDVGEIDSGAMIAEASDDETTTTTTEEPTRSKRVAVMRCANSRTADPRSIQWLMDGTPITKASPLFNVMNNGSLVVYGVTEQNEADLALYTCRVRGKRRSNDVTLMEVEDAAPSVYTSPIDVLHARLGSAALFDCELDGEPLTTRIEWLKDGMRVEHNENVRVLANNSLLVMDIDDSDGGTYACRAESALGSTFDEVELVVEEGNGGDVRVLEGYDGGERKQDLLLRATMRPFEERHEIDIKVDKLDPHADLTKYLVSTPLEQAGLEDDVDNYDRKANYSFETGETVSVGQEVVRDQNGYIRVKTKIDGQLPKHANPDNVRIHDASVDLTETAPGVIEGNGQSKMKFNNHSIGVRWIEKTRYAPKNGSDKPLIDPGKTLNVKASPLGRSKPRVVQRCPIGFRKNKKGRCEDINECEMIESPCEEDATCENLPGTYDCIRTCEDGFRVRLDGTCGDIDECETGTHDCGEGEACLNLEGSYDCKPACAVGFHLNDEGFCEDNDECADQSTCGKGLECLNTIGSFTCLCPNGRPPTNGVCKRPPRVKNVDNRRRQKKRCPPGFYEKNGQCLDLDECLLNAPCQYKCENTKGAYDCSCPEGYEVDESGDCKDIDECAESPCAEEEMCFNQLGGYRCIEDPCGEDYELDEDEVHCVPTCEDCDLPKVQLSLLSLVNDVVPGHAIARLTAFDNDGTVLNDTDFKLAKESRPNEYKYTRDGAFSLKADKGKSLVLVSSPLVSGSEATLRVRAKSASAHAPDTHFFLYVHVGDHPF